MKPPPNFQLRLCLFLNYCAYALQLSSVGIAVLQVQRSFGVSLVAASALAIYKGVGILIGALAAGAFVKRIGYRRAMLIALGASAAVLAVLPALVSFTAVKLAFLVTGMSYGLMKVALYATVGLIAPTRPEHASLLTHVEACYKIGGLLTFVVFAWFTDNAHPESTSWVNAYLVLAALMAAAFVLLLTTQLDERSLRDEAQAPVWRPLLDMARLAVTPMVITLGFLVVSCVVTEQGIMNWLPSFYAAVMHLAPTLGIELAGLNAGWLIAGRLCTGFVLRRVGWFPVLVGCVLGTTAILVISLLLGSGPAGVKITDWRQAPLAAWLLPATGFFIGPIFPVIHSAALTSLPVARHPTLASLSVVFSSSAGAIGTALLGVVFQAYGGIAALYSLLVPLAVMLAGFHVMRRVTHPMAA